MPYVTPTARAEIDPALKPILDFVPGRAPGDLNYIITRLIHAWLGNAPNYEAFNSAVGVLESAKLELYRRRVSPYEDKKIRENGDV